MSNIKSTQFKSAIRDTKLSSAGNNSKIKVAIERVTEIELERAIRRRSIAIANLIIDELEINRFDKTLVGLLCKGYANSNEKEVVNWILEETANVIDYDSLMHEDTVKDLKRKLENLLDELERPIW